MFGESPEKSRPFHPFMGGGGTPLHASKPSAIKSDDETMLLDEILVVSKEINNRRRYHRSISNCSITQSHTLHLAVCLTSAGMHSSRSHRGKRIIQSHCR